LKAALKEHFDQLELVSADLSNAAQLMAAATDCTYVVHTASPFYFHNKDDDELIRPAVDGTLAIMEACKQNKVKRCVITSSCAAILAMAKADAPDPATGQYDETCWSNPDRPEGMNGYFKSKTLAEKAAWNYVEELPAEDKFEVVTICPTFIQGPSLVPGGVSVSFGESQLSGKRETQPAYYGFVDVRDVSKMHLLALTKPEAANQRFIAYSERVTGEAIAKALSDEFTKEGFKITMAVAEATSTPDATVSNAKARKVFGMDFISGTDSVVAMARSVVDLGLVNAPL
jgi:nucleoside-diphosphate-sugar epimerase